MRREVWGRRVKKVEVSIQIDIRKALLAIEDSGVMLAAAREAALSVVVGACAGAAATYLVVDKVWQSAQQQCHKLTTLASNLRNARGLTYKQDEVSETTPGQEINHKFYIVLLLPTFSSLKPCSSLSTFHFFEASHSPRTFIRNPKFQPFLLLQTPRQPLERLSDFDSLLFGKLARAWNSQVMQIYEALRYRV